MNKILELKEILYNKRYIKINKYKVFFVKDENNLNKNIKYKKKLIEYKENYKKFYLYQDQDRLEIFY